jgi:DNA-directed RNA polymerase subunit F
VNWPEELFNDFYNPASGVEGTIAIRVDKLLMNVWKCAAIEKTMDTEARGKYMLIFKDEDIEKAKELIGELIEASGRNSDRKCAKIALDKFKEFPEFDSIQRVSQSVQSKGQRIRQMLEIATTKRTKSTPKKQLQPKFQFHVNKDLQQQLPITTNKTYSTITSQHTPSKQQPRLTQNETRRTQIQQNKEQQISMTQETVPTQMPTPTHQQELHTPLTNQTTETRTIATNNSGLSADQQMLRFTQDE